MHLLGSAVLFSVMLSTLSAPTEDWQTASSIYDFSAKDIDGNEVSLEKYRNLALNLRSRILPSPTMLISQCSVRSM
uniref:Glutathione peroxidase 4a n=1 Tax=Oncorhynchus mykiss TaxID=8022 RepID=A0A8K9UV30_ONCMY